MTNNLKIEVLVSNIPEDGSIASQFPSQEYVNQQLAKKANLSSEGRLDPAQAPDYTEIPGLYDHIEDTKDEIESSIASSLQDAKGYTNQQLSEGLRTKADLVNGKIPFDQIPFSADIEEQIQINVENITAVVDRKVAQVVEQVNGVATAANAYTDTKVAENKAYVDSTVGNVIEDVTAIVNTKTVSKEFTIPTYLTPEAGVAAGTGVAAGAYYNVRSDDGDTMLVEYQNNGGFPTPSGKSYPSSIYVKGISEYTALPFKQGRSYALYSRVQLDNGNIVKSTIANNTVNPNTDMTGWTDTSAAQNIKNLLGGSVQDFIDQQLETNTFLKNISVTPETYGAVGDGAADDTIAIKAWWESPIVYKQARGKYKINLGTSGTTHTTDKSLFVDMVGAEFIPTAQAGYLFQISYTGVGGVIEVRGGHCSSNNLIVRPLRIYGSGRVKHCIIKYNSATDAKENGQGYTAAALMVSVSSDLTLIQGNAYNGVSRTTDNAGLVTCAGISVTNIDATCIIHGNSIKNIKSLGDTDADGVITFTSNRLVTPSELQRVNIHITGNSFTDCQGRYVKAQGPAKVYSNYFEAISLPLITAFRAVDAQFGGVQCFDNIWRLSAGLRTLGGETAFYFYNGKGDTGSEENVGYCRDNILFLADDIRYLAFVQGSGGKHSVVIKDNIIKDEDGLTKVSQLVRLNIPDSAAIGSMDLSIESNTYTSRLADLLILTGAGFGQATLNDKLRLTVARNKPKNITNGARLIRTTPEANNPYMGDFLICNNGTQAVSYNTLVARGLDLNKLQQGNSFYYENDGSGAGGLINAPTGYSRSVFVDVKSTVEITKFTGEKKAVKAGAAGWYEYTGVLLT